MTTLICTHTTIPRELDGAGIEAAVLAAVPARKAIPRWYVGYSLEEAMILYASDALPANWGKTTIGGRLFDKEREVRWQLNGDCFDMWTLYESVGDQLVAREVKYYCLGKWDASKNCFIEGKLPRDLPQWVQAGWPLPVTGTSANDRMFFKVIEYSPARLIHSDPNECQDQKIARITKELNQPRIVAHRLVDVGSDPGEGDL